MATEFPGMSPLQAGLSKLGQLPAGDRADFMKSAFDGIARETQIPANVLIALDEAEGGTGDAARARSNAQRLAETLKGGGSIEDAIGGFIGEPGRAKAIMDRSYDIADAIYPAAEASAAPEASGGRALGLAADLGKTAGGAAVTGVGGMLHSVGVMGDELLKGAIERFGSRPAGADSPEPVEGETFVRGAGRAAGDAVQGAGQAISDSASPEFRQAMVDSTPSGELFSPSTWDFGDDPSATGIAGVTAQGLGSMLPMLVSRNPYAAAAMGGLMSGGEGAQNGRQFVIDAAQTMGEDGQPEIAKLPAYQALIGEGKSHDQATMALAREAETNAGFRQGLIGAFGGAATNRIFRGAEGWLGSGGRLASAAKKAGAGAIEEGSQEALEGAAALSGIAAETGANLNLAEDSFGNFVMGALAGGVTGAAGGAIFGGPEQTEANPESDEGPANGLPAPEARLALPPPSDPRSGLSLPAPESGGTIFGGGPVGRGPGEVERQPGRPGSDSMAAQPAQFRRGAVPGEGSPLVEAETAPDPTAAAAAPVPSGPLALPAPSPGDGIMGAIPMPVPAGYAASEFERDPARPRRDMTNATMGPAAFRPPSNSSEDGSLGGAAAAPEGGSPLSAPSGAAAKTPMGAMPAPTGPISAIAQTIQTPAPTPQPVVRFPEQKAGSAIRIGDPDSGQIFDGVFIGETPDGARIRIGGREIDLTPEDFDMGRDAVVQIEAAQKAAAEAAKQEAKGNVVGGSAGQAPVSGGSGGAVRLGNDGPAGGAPAAGGQADLSGGVSPVRSMDRLGGAAWQGAGAAGSGDMGGVDVANGAGQPTPALTPRALVLRAPVKPATATTPRGRKIPVEYAIADLDSLIPSQMDDGRPNPVYPQELQPRDRTRDTSQEQIRRIAQRLDPELLGENPQAGNGAPIILPTGEVLSGNGRTLALRRAAQEFPGSIEAYRKFLASQGYPVDGVANPALVRVVTEDMDMPTAARVAREANESEQQAMSISEQAVADAQSLTPAMLDLYQGGDIDLVQNRDFVRAFIRDVASASDAGRMHDRENRMTQDAIRRINAALLARAYGDAGIVAAVLENADSNIRALGGALTDVAPKWAQMRADVERGTIAADADRTAALVEAVKIVDRARRQASPVTDFVDQTDIFEGESVSPAAMQFLELFYRDPNFKRPRGREGVAAALDFYVSEALKTSPGVDMFGDSADTGAILNAAVDRSSGDREPSTDQDAGPERAEPPAGPGAAQGGEGRAEREAAPPADEVGRPVGEDRDGDVSPDAASQQVTPSSPDTYRSWRSGVPSKGTVRGWTVFDDTGVGGSWVLMSRDLQVRPFDSEQAARAWAQDNPETAFDTDGSPQSSAPSGGPVTEAGAEGLPQTVIPGAERSGDQARQAETDRAALEMKARQQQSKIRRMGGNSGDAGPLFDTQGDMFSAAAAQADPAPTEAQKEAGNYRKGHVRWNGLDLTIENAKGSERSGTGPDGTAWSVTMPAHYGYFRGTEGADGDHVDFYMGDAADSDVVVVLNQVDAESGAFDEHKVMIGFPDEAAAMTAYEAGFSDGRGEDRIGGTVTMTVDELKSALTDPGQWLTAMPKRAEAPSVADQIDARATDRVQTQKVSARGADKIEDFGQKLGGARKDTWSAYADKMEAAMAADVEAEPLSKSWPAPDYEALIEVGIDQRRVSFARIARDAIPTKPQKSWRLKGWVAQVRLLRGMAQKVLDGTTPVEKLAGNASIPDITRLMELYEAVGHSKSLKGLRLRASEYSIIGGVTYNPPKVVWEVSAAAKATAFSNMPRTIAAGDTKEAAIAAFKKAYAKLDDVQGKAKTARKWSVYSHNNRAYFTVSTKIGNNTIEMRRVDTVEEARRIIKEEADQLEVELAKRRDIPKERRGENLPRVGIDHRTGADVTPEQFGEAFGFRGVEFGNWVEKSRRQQDLNQAYDALMDLSGVLGLPPRAISLNGTLGLAFGARGGGGDAAAHYEPGKVVINLTKTQGAGSLAHEWFHAIDNHMAKRITSRTGRAVGVDYMSNNAVRGANVEGLRPELVDAFIAVHHAIGKTELKRRSGRLDGLRSKAYWGTAIEYHARAFESYVIGKLADQSMSNDYLVNTVTGESWAGLAQMSGLGDSYPYLKADELEIVRPAFDALFDMLQLRDTDTGVEMYRRDALADADASVPTASLRSISSLVGKILASHGIEGTVSPKVVRGLLSASGVPVQGSYQGGEVRVNANAANPAQTARHEVIHALRDPSLWGRSHGLFSPRQWQALVRAARMDPVIREAVDATYSDLSASQRAEEMVAELYADWATARAENPPRLLARALERIRSFFGALGAALRGEGFNDAAAVMRAIERGDIGRSGYPDGAGPGVGSLDQRTRITIPDAVIGGNLGSLTSLPDYAAAKAGDIAAAIRATAAVVTPELVEKVRSLIGDSTPIVVPVASVEASGRNKIPAAAAVTLAKRLGLETAKDIVQANAPHRTDMSGLDRVFAQPEFSGPIVAGQDYLLVDDTLTQGGTFAALVSHIEAAGGRVVGAVALTGKAYSAKLQLTTATLATLRGKYGDLEPDFQSATGYGFDSLTESEARTLAKWKPASAVRDRIFAARDARSDGRDGAADPVSRDQRDLSGLKASLSRTKARALGMTTKEGWQNTGRVWSNLLTDAMGRNERFNILSLVPGNPLFTELGKNLSAAQEYIRLKQDMDADRNKWQARAAEVVDRWTAAARRNPTANGDLMALMHEATLEGLDPSIQDGWRRTIDGEVDRVNEKSTPAKRKWAAGEKMVRLDRQKRHEKLRAKLVKMPKEFQHIFAEVRDEYAAMADAVDAALVENIRAQSRNTIKKADREHRKELARIREEGLEGAARSEALGKANEKKAKAHARAARGEGSRVKQLRQLFEENRVQGPYFPLARFGNYFVTVRDAEGKVVSFSRFESERAQTEWANGDAKALGEVQTGVLGRQDTDFGSVDPRFIADIEGILDEAGADRALMDAVYQRWLETLPDQSIRTAQIHRKGRRGFSNDAIRAYSSAMFHGAHQAARLRFGAEMTEALEVAEEQAQGARNANRAGFVVREMKQRHEFTMNPTNNPLVSHATGLAFVWYLGMSPAAALVNLSQTTVVGVPMMRARFKSAGTDGVIKELMKASGDFLVRGRGAVTKRVGGVPLMSEMWSVENAPNLTADERAAMEEGYESGVIDKTQGHDLAAVADSGVQYNPVREKVMRVIGWGFHHTERLNREVTYLAAYRLAKREGLSQAAAVSAASSMVWKTHFDYSNTSKPRVMQGDAAKVFLIFRNFQVNMLYRLFRDTHQILKGEDAEAKREARAQLIGVTLSMMGHAGIRGVWGYGLLMGLLSVFFPGADDGDDMDELLQDMLLIQGDSPATAAWNWAMGLVLNGAPGHVTGMDLTNRIGMPDLWFRSPDKDLEGKDLWAFYVEQMAGPLFGIGGNIVTSAPTVLEQAANLATFNGEFSGERLARGVEGMSPTFIRNMVKTGRYASEGVTTWYGDELVDSLNPWQLLMQFQGFSSAEVAERYQINNRLKRHEKRITDERKDIHREIGDAVRAGEPIPPSAVEKMRDFNQRFPEYAVTTDSIRASVQARERASVRNEFGVALNPKLNDRLREDRAPAIYN